MKNRVKISVDGKSFTLVGEETEEHMRQVAAYIDAKIAEVRENAVAVTLDSSLAYVLASINVADDYFKERAYSAELEGRILGMTARLRELNHKLEEAEGIQTELTRQHKEAEGIQAELAEKLAEAEKMQAELTEKLQMAERMQAEAEQKTEWAQKAKNRAETKLKEYTMALEENAPPQPHYANARSKNRRK